MKFDVKALRRLLWGAIWRRWMRFVQMVFDVFGVWLGRTNRLCLLPAFSESEIPVGETVVIKTSPQVDFKPYRLVLASVTAVGGEVQKPEDWLIEGIQCGMQSIFRGDPKGHFETVFPGKCFAAMYIDNEGLLPSEWPRVERANTITLRVKNNGKSACKCSATFIGRRVYV